jgi:hypothetical protein
MGVWFNPRFGVIGKLRTHNSKNEDDLVCWTDIFLWSTPVLFYCMYCLWLSTVPSTPSDGNCDFVHCYYSLHFGNPSLDILSICLILWFCQISFTVFNIFRTSVPVVSTRRFGSKVQISDCIFDFIGFDTMYLC